MEEIRAEVDLTRAEYVQGVQFVLRKSGLVGWLNLTILVLMIPVAASLIWLLGMTILNTALVVLLVMSAGLGVMLYFVQPGRTYDRMLSLRERTVYTFSQENIGVRSDSVAGVVKWSFQELWSGVEFYILFQGKQQYTILPKRCFADDEACHAFEVLMKQAVPDMKHRVF